MTTIHEAIPAETVTSEIRFVRKCSLTFPDLHDSGFKCAPVEITNLDKRAIACFCRRASRPFGREREIGESVEREAIFDESNAGIFRASLKRTRS